MTDTLATAFDDLAAAVSRDADGDPGLRSATVAVSPRIDPAAFAFAARRANERWFCWSEPERGVEIAGLGSVAEVVSRGPERMRDLQARCAATEVEATTELGGVPAGAGPLWVGGAAFDSDGGSRAHWSSLPPALLWMPELSLLRADDRLFVTAVARAGDEAAVARIRERLTGAEGASMPMLDPAPTGRVEVSSVREPAAYEHAVQAALERIERGEMEKIVLAREVRVEAPSAHDPAALYGALRELFPACFTFCVGTPEAAFLGASPELLVRRSGAVAGTVALAGSTRRSADPSVDDHLAEKLLRSEKDRAEQAIVARRIARQLDPVSVWVDVVAEPSVVKVANVQHIATPIRAQLAESRSAVELAGLLHPTPAVGAEPSGAAEAIAGLEQMERGWYAGPVGWMDLAEDGEFCVALRSALLRDRIAHLFAGAGIVSGSDPAAELAETEVKLEALLPLLAG